MPDIDSNKIRQLDGSLLLVLRELLRHRRTTIAAEQLGLSQSTVSHALARLRVLFDDELFIRRPHGLQPTRQALQIAPQVDELLDAMGSLLGATSHFDPVTSRRDFLLAAPDHLATLLAPGLAQRFASATNTRFALIQRLGDTALRAVARDEIDLAVGRFAGGITGFAITHLADDDYCLIARTDHPALSNGLTRATYVHLQHVQLSVDTSFGEAGPDLGGRSGPPRRIVATVPRFLVAFAVVAASDLVAVAPRALCRAHAPAFGLAQHNLPFPTDPVPIVAVHREHTSTATRWLLDQVVEVITDAW